MIRYIAFSFSSLVICVSASGGALDQPAKVTAATEGIVRAANQFLSSLSAEQRQKVVYAYDDASQRARWSNFPTGFVARGGIRLKDLTETQRKAAMNLLSEVLSPEGLKKVNQIQAADDDFRVNGSRRGPPGGGPPGSAGADRRGSPPQVSRADDPRGSVSAWLPPRGDMFGKDLYHISFLGTPSVVNPWMLQFGGHHLALNITIVGSNGVLTPTLTGAQPASFTLNSITVRPIGQESDKALLLLQSFDDKQRAQAVLNYTVADLVLGPGQDDKKISPEGLKASALNGKQQAMLLDLIEQWAGIVNEAFASPRMSQLKADLNDTWFAWSGAVEGTVGRNITAYYRIQGPHLVIEYAPQHDEPTNHVHTIYRDPTNDYGRALATP